MINFDKARQLVEQFKGGASIRKVLSRLSTGDARQIASYIRIASRNPNHQKAITDVYRMIKQRAENSESIGGLSFIKGAFPNEMIGQAPFYGKSGKAAGHFQIKAIIDKKDRIAKLGIYAAGTRFAVSNPSVIDPHKLENFVQNVFDRLNRSYETH